MEILIEHNAKTLIVTLQGSFDAVTAPQVDASLSQAFADGLPEKCIFSMEQVSYISSAGLRSVLGIAKTLRKAQGQLCFVGLVPSVKEVFDLSGFTSYFKDFPHLDAALAD